MEAKELRSGGDKVCNSYVKVRALTIPLYLKNKKPLVFGLIFFYYIPLQTISIYYKDFIFVMSGRIRGQKNIDRIESRLWSSSPCCQTQKTERSAGPTWSVRPTNQSTTNGSASSSSTATWTGDCLSPFGTGQLERGSIILPIASSQ